MKYSPNTFSNITFEYQNRQEPEQLRSLARAFWRISLGLVALIIVSSIGYGIYDLITVATDVSSTAQVTKVAAPSIDREKLSQVLSGLTNRKAEFDLIQKAPASSIADPSK